MGCPRWQHENRQQAKFCGVCAAPLALTRANCRTQIFPAAKFYGRSPNADKAVEYLDRANRKASRLNAMAEAKAHFVQAMGLLDALPDTEANRHRRVALLVNQALVFFLLFQIAEHYADLTRFEPIAVDVGDPSLLGAYYGSMAYCESGFGRFQQAIDRATRAAELCEAADNAEGAALAYGCWGGAMS